MNPDGAPDVPDEEHATAILNTPMGADEPPFPLTAYGSLPPAGRTQQQSQQQQQQFAYLESGSVNPHYGFNVETSSGQPTYQTSAEWQQANQQLMYGNAASVPVPIPVPSQGSLSSFGYETYEGHGGEQMEDTAMAHGHGHGYVAPMDTTLQMNFGYRWDTRDTTGMEFDPSPLQSPSGYQSTPVSPLATGTATGTGTPTSYASSSSGGQYPIMYTGANLQAQAVAAGVMGDEPTYAMGGEDERESTPIPKRTRTRPSLSRSSRPSFQIGSSSSSVPLSSMMGEGSMSSAAGPSSSQIQAQVQAQAQAHRHSSHSSTTPRQAEKKEEKKTRSSHNLVEKQYRNRLNAQFESLMNALPESLRLQGASLGVMGDGGEGMASDTPERKPSKAEVLEMARMHIRSLEQERNSLANERDGLLSDIERLQRIIESKSSAEEGGMAP